VDSLAPRDSLVVRTWNDTPIARRSVDGYVNATAMCKANGKEWFDYVRTERVKEYISALKKSLQGSPEKSGDLVQVISNGPNDSRGTYVHPRIAVDLARWINPEFAVWMDGWLLEELERQAQVKTEVPAPQPQISGTNVLSLLKESVDFIKDLGCFDDRDKILFSDLARNNAMRVNSDFLLPPGDEEMTISDAYLEVFQERLSRNKSSVIGKTVANEYRKEFNQDPPTRIQYVDGAPRKVKSYQKNWLIRTLSSINK
jgi:KilA-N domain